MPNISPDPNDGIGRWSEANFVTALWKGTSPGGANLYPALPYTSYQHIRLDDVRDLFAFLKTLPPVPGKVRRHDLKFPFSARWLLGGWKLLFLHGGPFVPDPSRSAQWNHGAYLVNGPGHCAECHSPRNFLGAIVDSERFAGGPAPDGSGWVPNITPAGLQHGDEIWSQKDIASFLGDGMTPSGDFVGSTMAEVIRNTSLLGPERPGRHRRLHFHAAARAGADAAAEEKELIIRKPERGARGARRCRGQWSRSVIAIRLRTP